MVVWLYYVLLHKHTHKAIEKAEMGVSSYNNVEEGGFVRIIRDRNP